MNDASCPDYAADTEDRGSSISTAGVRDATYSFLTLQPSFSYLHMTDGSEFDCAADPESGGGGSSTEDRERGARDAGPNAWLRCPATGTGASERWSPCARS